MYVLQVLPDEYPIPLDGAYAGVIAVVKPFDNEELAKYYDSLPKDDQNQPSIAVTKERLVRIEGLGVKVGDDVVPYDHANEVHRRSLPLNMLSSIYLGLMDRASLSEETSKNSDLPSVSGGTTPGENTPAQNAASQPETS